MNNPHYAWALSHYRGDVEADLAALDAHHAEVKALKACHWGPSSKLTLPERPNLPVVDLSPAERADMERFGVRLLRPEMASEDDAGDASWEEMYVAWRVHCETHHNCAWLRMDGSPLMFSHVASSIHILRQMHRSSHRMSIAA